MIFESAQLDFWIKGYDYFIETQLDFWIKDYDYFIETQYNITISGTVTLELLMNLLVAPPIDRQSI